MFSTPSKSKAPSTSNGEIHSLMGGFIEKKGPLIHQWKKFYAELIDSSMKLYSDNRKLSKKVEFHITAESDVKPFMENDHRNDNLF